LGYDDNDDEDDDDEDDDDGDGGYANAVSMSTRADICFTYIQYYTMIY
jgi:hypothetical protein